LFSISNLILQHRGHRRNNDWNRLAPETEQLNSDAAWTVLTALQSENVAAEMPAGGRGGGLLGCAPGLYELSQGRSAGVGGQPRGASDAVIVRCWRIRT